MKKNDKKLYVCLIGDIRGSRNIKDREKLQKEFNKTISKINEIYKSDIISQFNVTLGDEFQGVLKSGDKILEIITYIRINLKNIDFRYGVGIGEISTSINKNNSLNMDGPCFYAARKAIDRVKEIEKSKKLTKTDICVLKYNNESETNDINLLLKNIKNHYDKMKDNQKEFINDVIYNNEINISLYAKKKKMTEQAISKVLLKANIYLYRENYNYINKRMEELL